ncbi:GntR family transcriptional regulator [Cellulomonas hominis]
MHLTVVATSPTRRKADSARGVRDLLRAQILGTGFPDAQLPSETDLMREFQVGRNVVRAALAQLQRQGLVARIQGAGTFVVVHKNRHSLVAGGIGASIADPMARLETRVLAERRGLVGATAAVRLGIPVDEPCLVVESVNLVDGEPLMVTTSYVPGAERQRALEAAIAPGHWRGDWYEALVRAGMDVRVRELVTEAVAADELVAGDLDVEIGAPLMFVERRLLLGDGAACEYGFSHCRGDRFAFAYEVDTFAPGTVQR